MINTAAMVIIKGSECLTRSINSQITFTNADCTVFSVAFVSNITLVQLKGDINSTNANKWTNGASYWVNNAADKPSKTHSLLTVRASLLSAC